MRNLTFSALSALTLSAMPVSAQVIGDADVIANLMQSYGLIVEQDRDDYGDPRLTSRLEGTRFSVYFYDCEQGSCESIQFTAGFDLDTPMPLQRVNDWNRDKRFGKVYLDDEGDPYVEYDVNLDLDGVGARNFDDTLDIWRQVLTEFRDHIDW